MVLPTLCFSQTDSVHGYYNDNISYIAPRFDNYPYLLKETRSICSEIMFAEQYNKDIKTKLDSLDYEVKYMMYNLNNLYNQRKQSRNIILTSLIIANIDLLLFPVSVPILAVSGGVCLVGVVVGIDSNKWIRRTIFGPKLYLPNTMFLKQPEFKVTYNSIVFKYSEYK